MTDDKITRDDSNLIHKSLKVNIDTSNLASYKDIKDKLQPFDLIAFRGNDFVSNFISEIEQHHIGNGAFSHVGMVVTADILPSCIINGTLFTLKPNHPYLFESTFTYGIPGFTDGIPDVITNKGKFGVQLRDLEEVIPRYITDQTSKVAWCKLLNNPFDDEFKRDELIIQFTDFFTKYHGRIYEIDIESLFSAMFPRFRFIRNVRDSIFNTLYSFLYKCGLSNENYNPAKFQFCSELVANVYQTIGIIPSLFDPRDVLPVDFFGCDEDRLPILVEPPVFIKDWDVPNQPAIEYINNN